MLQRQIMFKQLQELQRQRKLRELNDARQQNVINEQSLIHNKQAYGVHYSPLIDGTPVHDASQMFMFGNRNLVQGSPNELVYSQGQSQVPHSMSFASQQLDGTPVSSTGHSFSQYSQFHRASQDSDALFTKYNSQHRDNLFGPAFTKGLDMVGETESTQNVTNNQRNALFQEFGSGQEQGGWPCHDEKTEKVNPSQSFTNLDPLEQKILFNMDDNSWGGSLGKQNNTGTGGFENMFENTDHLSAFPSLQSGSWSALMQSAVEASSSETGVQEEWSGLSFQNPEHSNDNHPSSFVESGKHTTPWLDDKLQNASSSSPKPELLNATDASSSFPGFQHFPDTHFQIPKKYNMLSDSSHMYAKKADESLNSSAQEKEPYEGSTEVQRFQPSVSGWHGKNFEHLQSDPHQQKKSLCNEPHDMNNSDRSETMIADHMEISNSPVSEGNQKQSGQVQRLSSDGERQGRDISGMSSFPAPNSTSLTSHNMLELLNKVDRFREYRPDTQSGYSYSTPTTEVPKANADAVTPSNNSSSASQYFGLRLAPPTQRPHVNYFDSSLVSQQEHSIKELQGHQSDSQQLHSQNSGTNHSPQETPSYIGSRYPSFDTYSSQETSHLAQGKNQVYQQSLTFEVNRPLTTSAMAQQIAFSTRPPNVWLDVSEHQNSFGTESFKAPCGSPSTSDAADGRMDPASEALKELEYQKFVKGGNNLLNPGAHFMSTQSFDYEKGQTGKVSFGEESRSGHPEANASFSSSLMQGSHRVQHNANQALAISSRDVEAFGRSLKQAHVPPHNSSLLNPMDHYPSVRATISNERVDFDISIPQISSVTQLDSAYKNFRTQPIGDHLVKNPSQTLLQDTSQGTFPYKKDGFHSQPAGDDMASKSNARESLHSNSSLVQGNSVGTVQYRSSVWPATGTNLMTVSHLSSPYLQHLDERNQNMVVLKSRKRKFPTFELLPWHKEVTGGSSKLQDTSTAELEWARATNRLPEKLKEDARALGDSLWMVWPKRRLVLTTQLMQLLFQPATAVILSDGATAKYNTVTFFVARLALGDACSLASHSHTPLDISNKSSGKIITSKSSTDQFLSRIVENFIDRSKMLEDELLRLENRGSILDIRMECQELEKFSVINRFAKFHSRGPAETQSSGGASTVPKLYPQRYVTASPMPRTVPERQHCLSL